MVWYHWEYVVLQESQWLKYNLLFIITIKNILNLSNHVHVIKNLLILNIVNKASYEILKKN
jgi:hypothetical protein